MMEPTSTGPDWEVSPAQVTYPAALAAMRRRVDDIRAGAQNELVWLLEHPPLYTAGTSAQAGDLTDPGRFETFMSGRGGQWTYHGPGQLVAYVMLDLTRPHGHIPARDTHAYVTALETWLMAALAEFGVQGLRRSKRVGVWIEDPRTHVDHKIAAVGVRITRWVSWHGVALNVRPDLTHFDGIVPCGIREHGVTSLRDLGIDISLDQAAKALQAAWPGVFGQTA